MALDITKGPAITAEDAKGHIDLYGNLQHHRASSESIRSFQSPGSDDSLPLLSKTAPLAPTTLLALHRRDRHLRVHAWSLDDELHCSGCPG